MRRVMRESPGGADIVQNKISALVIYETSFMASSVERLLSENGFHVVANMIDGPKTRDLEFETPPDICVIGCHAQGFDDLCIWLRERFQGSRLVLLDTSDRAKIGHAESNQPLDGCIFLDLSPDLIVAGLQLVNEGVLVLSDEAMRAANHAIQPCASHLSALTPREVSVLELIGQGMSNKLIARKLDITESTVKAHLNSVLRKTGTSNRTQAARWAFEQGQLA
jgi:two-component system nitrate/nitrite response regulator NarL